MVNTISYPQHTQTSENPKIFGITLSAISAYQVTVGSCVKLSQTSAFFFRVSKPGWHSSMLSLCTTIVYYFEFGKSDFGWKKWGLLFLRAMLLPFFENFAQQFIGFQASYHNTFLWSWCKFVIMKNPIRVWQLRNQRKYGFCCKLYVVVTRFDVIKWHSLQ